MKQANPELLILLASFACEIISAEQGVWPASHSLVAFWPLDAESHLDDVANGNALAPCSHTSPQLMSDISGPFGRPNTSYSVINGADCIGTRRGFAPMSKFTLSFYYFSQAKKRVSGIVRLSDSSNTSLSLFYAAPSYLSLWINSRNARLVDQISEILPNTWTFVALTYDEKNGKRLTLFDQDGNVTGYDTIKDMSPPTEISVGSSYYWSYSLGMSTTDAMACVMLYKTVLTPSQIAELPHHCQRRRTTTAPPLTTGSTTGKTVVRALPGVKRSWPRDSSLLAFWPLNLKYLFNDISSNHFNAFLNGLFVTGPFGDANTAAKPRSSNTTIFEVSDRKLSVTGSFTIGMFLSLGNATKEGGVFEFQDRFESSLAFQFRYENATTLEVSANGKTIGHYTMIQQKGVWTFVAFVFDERSANFTVYGRHGVVAPPTPQPDVRASTTFNNNGIRLGYSTRWQQSLRTTDSVSCLVIYSTALTASEIRQVIDACRIAHGSESCGAPKLPLLPAIPSSFAKTIIPKAGQFPYIASLRSGPIAICSATIIDAYWVLTSALCFAKSKNASHYTIYVGEHDLAVVESFNRAHSLSKIIVPQQDSPGKIALVQLEEPIDFSNAYVNDVCLFQRGEEDDELTFDAAQFVFGWGKNGRPSGINETLPRCVTGLMQTNDQCRRSWGTGIYSAGSDFCFMSASNDMNVPCTGDEGGPLLVQARGNSEIGTRDRLVQVGVYYKRDAECSPTKPGLFANIAKYTNWITEKIACAVPGVAYPVKCPQ